MYTGFWSAAGTHFHYLLPARPHLLTSNLEWPPLIPRRANNETRLESSPAMAPVKRKIHYRLLLLMASLLLLATCYSLNQRRQTRELATGRQTAHEDPTVATSTVTIPSKLSNISIARISRNISKTSIFARVPNTTLPSILLAQLLSKWFNESALPKVPKAQLQCSDAICSNFSLPNFKCMNRIRDIVKRIAAPTCRFQKGESKPKYLLTSFPGSGNTWVRQVLEKATGICTGDAELHEPHPSI